MANHRVPPGLHQALDQYLRVESGYWADGRDQTHRFVLSPDLLVLSAGEMDELRAIARGVRTLLQAVERATVTVSNGSARGNSWQMFRKFLGAGVRKSFAQAQATFGAASFNGVPGIAVPAIKLDLLRSPSGFRIVEIDGSNQRALAFHPWMRGAAEVVRSHVRGAGFDGDCLTATPFPGVVPAIVSALQERGQTSLLMILVDAERFYWPCYVGLADALRQAGIDVDLVQESDLRPSDEAGRLAEDRGRVLFSIPLMPRTGRDSELLKKIQDLQHSVLFPPKPVWSSQGLLALLHSETTWAAEVLNAHTDVSGELRQLSNFAPATWFPGRRHQMPVIKAVQASGSHGVLLPASADGEYARQYASVTSGRTTLGTVFQEPVRLARSRYRRFDGDGSVRVSKDWHERLIVHISGMAHDDEDDILDVDVTACRDGLVHGGPECLQFMALRGA